MQVQEVKITEEQTLLIKEFEGDILVVPESRIFPPIFIKVWPGEHINKVIENTKQILKKNRGRIRIQAAMSAAKTPLKSPIHKVLQTLTMPKLTIRRPTINKLITQTNEWANGLDEKSHSHERAYPRECMWNFCFCIKCYNDVPDIASDHLSDNEIWNTCSLYANDEIEWIIEDLKTKYDWIDNAIVTGRSGGWLEVETSNSVLDDIYNIDDLEQEWGNTRDGNIEIIENLLTHLESLATIYHDLDEIEDYIKDVVNHFKEKMESKKFWKEEILCSKGDDYDLSKPKEDMSICSAEN